MKMVSHRSDSRIFRDPKMFYGIRELDDHSESWYEEEGFENSVDGESKSGTDKTGGEGTNCIKYLGSFQGSKVPFLFFSEHIQLLFAFNILLQSPKKAKADHYRNLILWGPPYNM